MKHYSLKGYVVAYAAPFLIFFASLTLGLALRVSAQKTAWNGEINTTVAAKSLPGRQANLYATAHDDDSKVGGFLWGLLQSGYGEALAGPLYAPASWAELGVGYGFEQISENKTSQRVLGQIWLGSGSYSILAIGEDGGSGAWYKITALKQVSPQFAAGLLAQRYKGVGPRFDLKFARHFKFWVAETQDGSRRKTIFAIDAKY